MTQYKRTFGPQEANNAPTVSALPRCQQCGKSGGVCMRHVMLDYLGGAPFHTVCYKNQCVYCGAIQYWNGTDKNGEPRVIPAFYVLHTATRRPILPYREFSLPRELFQTPDGKADVGLKVRIISALLRLQLERPTEYVFTIHEVYDEMQRAG